MPSYALLLEYDGSNFCGFQRQSNLPTVQETLEVSIGIALREKNIHIISAGRTDARVHATGMIAGFRTETKIDNFFQFLLSINHLCGRHLSAIDMKEVPESFHPQYSCTEREYQYWIFVSKFPSPLLNGRAYFFKAKFDFEKIREECKSLVGKHDFTSFAKPIALLKKTPVRTVSKLDIRESNEVKGLYKLEIRSSGFLHNMVRIIAGTLLDIGKGKIKDRNITEILEKKDRKYAGTTLPAHGLYFRRATYEKFPEINSFYEKK